MKAYSLLILNSTLFARLTMRKFSNAFYPLHVNLFDFIYAALVSLKITNYVFVFVCTKKTHKINASVYLTTRNLLLNEASCLSTRPSPNFLCSSQTILSFFSHSFSCQSLSTPSFVFQNSHGTHKAKIVYHFKNSNHKFQKDDMQILNYSNPYTFLNLTITQYII